MADKEYDPAQEILRDPTGDIAKLRKMGITDFALITYMVRVRDGKTHEAALQGLLQGRSLAPDQERFVRRVLGRYPIRKSKSADGFAVLDSVIIDTLDCICDSDKVFLGGLLLIVSPLVTDAVVAPVPIIYLMMFGLLCAVAAVVVPSFE